MSEDGNKKAIVVGLTGQTGAGKTSVSTLLSRLGFIIIDADSIARDVVEKGEQCLAEIAYEFGMEILNDDGTLNRQMLAEIAFKNRHKLSRLNQITHPHILSEIKMQIEFFTKSGSQVIFLDAPTLFESGADSLCDCVVSVIAPKKIRAKRIIARDKITEDEALTRISAQHGDSYYTRRSSLVIDNGGDISTLHKSVMGMIEQLGVAE
ncbi:MAG: dephospho-CoA kinase [Oscillospiraceae bacterium]|nr:dephospho-CoA kinase [Oscillospiraceae bacterium]